MIGLLLSVVLGGGSQQAPQAQQYAYLVESHRRASLNFAIAKRDPHTPREQLDALERMVVDLEASLRKHPCSWSSQSSDLRSGVRGMTDSNLTQ